MNFILSAFLICFSSFAATPRTPNIDGSCVNAFTGEHFEISPLNPNRNYGYIGRGASSSQDYVSLELNSDSGKSEINVSFTSKNISKMVKVEILSSKLILIDENFISDGIEIRCKLKITL